MGWPLGTWPPLTSRLVEGEGVEWTGPHPWKPPSVQLSGVSEGLGRGQGCFGQGTPWQAGPSVEAENPGVLGHLRVLSSHLPGQDRGGCCWACAIQRFFHLCLTLTEGPSTRWGRHSLLGLGQKPDKSLPSRGDAQGVKDQQKGLSQYRRCSQGRLSWKRCYCKKLVGFFVLFFCGGWGTFKITIALAKKFIWGCPGKPNGLSGQPITWCCLLSGAFHIGCRV